MTPPTPTIDVDLLSGLIEDAAIKYSGGTPVDFRPVAAEIAALVLEDAEKLAEQIAGDWPFGNAAAACLSVRDEIRALAAGVR